MSRDSRPWIKVSVDMWRHPKIRQLTAAQFRTLIALWSMSMEYQTDGVLDVKFARAQGLRPACLTALAEAGLMDLSDDGQTLRLHDYLEHQMSADKIAARTNQRRSAGRRGGIAKAANAAEHQPIPDVNPATSSGPTQRRVEPLLSDEYEPYSATSKALTQRRRNHEMAGQQVDGFSEPLRHTRGRAQAAEEEREEEHHIPPNAAASLNASREQAQRQQPPNTHWADDVPIPPEPPADHQRPTLELVHTGDHAPAVIDAQPPPARGKPSDAALALVRSTVPRSVGRQIAEQLAREVDKLGRDRDIDRADIAAALTEWARRPGAGPRLLPNLVADAARARTTQNAPHETSAMNRGREYIEIGERLAQRLEAQQSTTTSPKELR